MSTTLFTELPEQKQVTKEKRHNTATTSIEAFKQNKVDGKLSRNDEKVLAAIVEHQPVTSRALSTITGIERTSVCGNIYHLEAKNKIKVGKVEKCPITGKRVRWYATWLFPQTKFDF